MTIEHAVQEWPHASEIKRRLVNHGYDVLCRYRCHCRGAHNNQIAFYLRKDRFTELPLVEGGAKWRDMWSLMSMEAAEQLADKLDAQCKTAKPEASPE